MEAGGQLSHSNVVRCGKHPVPPCLPHYSTNRLVWYPILAWHPWHTVLLPAVKSVCLPRLLAKNAPLCKHMCHFPSPLHLLLWLRVPNSPCMIICISLSSEKHTICMLYKSNFCIQKHQVWEQIAYSSVCRCLYLCQWGLRHLLCHLLHCPTTAQQGVIKKVEDGCTGGLSTCQRRAHLHFKICLLPGCVLCLSSAWMLSLKTVCPTERQHYAYKHRHSDIKTTCAEFKRQTDRCSYVPCTNHAIIKAKRYGLWNSGTYVEWLYIFESIPNKVTFWDIHRTPLLRFSLLTQR